MSIAEREKSMSLTMLEELSRLPLTDWTPLPRRTEYEDHREYMTAEVVDGFETLVQRGKDIQKVALERALPLAPHRLQPPRIPYRLTFTEKNGHVATYQVGEDAAASAGMVYAGLQKFFNRRV